MKCNKCGRDNPDGNLFCGSCGERLASYVPSADDARRASVKRDLEPGEKVLWQGGPEFWPFLLSGFGGTVFGLYIVWKVMKRYGGGVSVREIRPRGVIFDLVFPLYRPSDSL